MKEVKESPGFMDRACAQMVEIMKSCAKDQRHCTCTVSIDDGNNRVGEPKLMIYCSDDKDEVKSMESSILQFLTVEPIKIVK